MGTQAIGNLALLLGQRATDLRLRGVNAQSDRHAKLSKDAAQGVDVSVPGAHPLTTKPMQSQDLLLFECFDGYRPDVRTAHGFYKSCSVGSVGLVAFHIGAHVLRRKQ
jgi:hypothetical protein